MKQPSFHGRAHHPLSDWETNHRPTLPSVKVDSSFYGGRAVSILLAARRAPPSSDLGCSIIGASKPSIPCCFRFALPPANPDEQDRINNVPQGPCWADGQSSRAPWATDSSVPFAPECLGRSHVERCQGQATEDRSLQRYLEEGRDGDSTPSLECRAPRRWTRSAKGRRRPLPGGRLEAQAQEAIVKNVSSRRAGARPKMDAGMDEDDLLQHTRRFSAPADLVATPGSGQPFPWTSGQGGGGGGASAIMPPPLPGGRPPCAMRRACLVRDGFEFTDHISSLPQSSFWATILSCSRWR